MYELCFESLNMPRMCFMNQGVCSLASIGKTTGLVVDCGEISCSSTPVFEG